MIRSIGTIFFLKYVLISHNHLFLYREYEEKEITTRDGDPSKDFKNVMNFITYIIILT